MAEERTETLTLMDITASSMDLSGEVETEEECANNYYKCEICTYETIRITNLMRHVETHKLKKPGSCSSPVRSAAKTDNNNNVSFVCDQCAKRFGTKFGLSLHLKNKHDHVFKHTCQVCGKGYNQSAQFRAHCSSHQGIENAKCSFCKSTFSIHVPKASPDQLICSSCGHIFATKAALGEHRRGKHQQPRYMCEQCGKQFSWRSSLAAHRRHSHK